MKEKILTLFGSLVLATGGMARWHGPVAWTECTVCRRRLRPNGHYGLRLDGGRSGCGNGASVPEGRLKTIREDCSCVERSSDQAQLIIAQHIASMTLLLHSLIHFRGRATSLLLVLGISLLAHGQTIRYVSRIGTNTNPATATSWANATNNLQGAINASAVNDQVWVAAGTYKPTATTSRTISFAMKSGVAIYGSFVGTETALSQRPPINPVSGSPASSTLSGDIGTVGNNTDNSYHVISNLSGLNASALLDGFVITGGTANGAFPNNSGGGVFNNGSGADKGCSPRFQNCLLTGNTATSGGAMFNDARSGGQSSPQLTNCLLQANTAFNGGAIFNYGSVGISNPVLTNCALQANSASYGGAMYNYGSGGISNPVLTNCSLQANTAAQDAGAMFNSGFNGRATPVLTNCVVFGNGGSNTFYNQNALVSATYTLFDNSVTRYRSDPTNRTTLTSPFVSAGSVALEACSPAINAGSNTAYASAGGPATDLAGNPRVFPAGGTIDMGAVEFQAAPLLPSTRLYVRAGASGANTGLSWTDAFTDLQSALTYPCRSLTEIWVASGTYKPTATTARTASFAMRNGVAIYGSFVGTETALSQRPPINPVSGSPASSTLSGDIGTVGNNTDNSYHVISNPGGLNASALLDGFVITEGNANGAFPNNLGGGVFNNGIGAGNTCSPSFRNCLLTGNMAADGGGAMFNYGRNSGQSSPQLTNCALQANTAFGNGGAMYNDGIVGVSSPQLTNCALRANLAYQQGGAMFNYGQNGGVSSPQLTNCSFQANAAAGNGGAMYSNGANGVASPVLTNCVLFGNGGSNTFYNQNGSISATYSLFDNSVTGYSSSPTNLTTTTSPFVSASSVALAAGSPAINAGNPASVTVASPPYSATALPATDLIGNLRIVEGRVDMGAVEFSGPVVTDIYTLKTGLWSDPTVWSVGRLPLAGETLRLRHPVSVPSGYTALGRQLIYEAGGRLVFGAGSIVRLGL